MNNVKLQTVIEMYETNDIFQLYKVDMQDVVNSIYTGLMNDSEFISQMNCQLNDKATLYRDSYKERVERLIEDLIDPDKGDNCMLKYNLMRDDYIFYDKWRKELFERIYNELRG